MSFQIIGLDIETTSSDVKGELIQIGLYYPGHAFVSDVGHRGNFYREEKAFEVNGFSLERVYNGTPVDIVDDELCEYLLILCEDLGIKAWDLIPTGFNVGAFDMQFVNKTFPRFRAMLGYHTIDLNAVIMYYAPDNWKDRKKELKEEANKLAREARINGGEHDALFDAAQAYYIYQLLDVDV